MKAAVILSGCGVYDGAEIHESVFTLLALEEQGVEYGIYAPDKEQFHVVNHINGEEMPEKRNVLVEAARIARSAIKALDQLDAAEFDFLVIPGGFGAAKNLNQWAIKGPDGELDEEVKKAVLSFVNGGKAVCGLCMGPTVIAQSLKDSGVKATLTVGTSAEASPYEIDAIHQGMQSTGASTTEKSIREVQVDQDNKIVTAPCYMMEASLLEVRKNIAQAIEATVALV